MDQSSGVDIKKTGSFSAPTPQNTPSNPAPITSDYRPTVSTISEDSETATTSGGGVAGFDASALSGALTNNPALISMLQGKLNTLIGSSSGYIESLPPAVQRRINGLKYLQSKHSELEIQFQEEVLALEKKYLELYRPLYAKRAEVITGQYEPTDEEVAIGKNVDQDEDDKMDEDDEATERKDKATDDSNNSKGDDIKGIPEFWLTLLKNHPQLSETITDNDEQVLKHLLDIRMSYLDQPGFKLDFVFGNNEFFTNDTLSKTYYYQDHAYAGDFVYDHAEGCSIDWKEGKNLTVTVESRKQRHKGTNKTRVIKRTMPADSFFNFFCPPSVPDEDEDMDEEEAEGLDAKLEADYEAGEEFKDKIIPHAVDYFTGKALQYDGLDNDDEFEGGYSDEDDDLEEDDDDDEDEDDDDDDDDNDTQLNKNENAPECKQS